MSRAVAPIAVRMPISCVRRLTGTVKLTKLRLIDPQDDALEPVANWVCGGAASQISLKLIIPSCRIVDQRGRLRTVYPGTHVVREGDEQPRA
jgi:hypothetical protein